MPRWIFLALALPTLASAQAGAPGLDPQRPISQYLHDIWTIDLQSKKTRQLQTDLSDEEAPSWAGNSSTIAFCSVGTVACIRIDPFSSRTLTTRAA